MSEKKFTVRFCTNCPNPIKDYDHCPQCWEDLCDICIQDHECDGDEDEELTNFYVGWEDA